MKKCATLNPRLLATSVKQQSAVAPEAQGTARRAYRSPRLECFGDIRTLTLGGSPGFGDSINVPQNMPM